MKRSIDVGTALTFLMLGVGSAPFSPRMRALMEWVVLVGGFERDEFNLSRSWLAGYRLQNGVEFGVGPNMSVNREGDRTTSMVLAGGATLPLGDI